MSEGAPTALTSRMITGLNAVILIVKDLEAQKRFYRDVLGLTVSHDYGDAVFFECGGQTLGLFAKGHHAEGTARLEGAPKGVSHLEFRIDAKEQAALDERLRKAGYHVYRDNYCDADGNLFHFV